MLYQEAKALSDQIDGEVRAASAALRTFPKGAYGITPDAVKFSQEYRAAKTACDAAVARQRAYNAVYLKAFAKEIAADRAARRAA